MIIYCVQCNKEINPKEKCLKMSEGTKEFSIWLDDIGTETFIHLDCRTNYFADWLFRNRKEILYG